jgi:TonB family protein
MGQGAVKRNRFGTCDSGKSPLTTMKRTHLASFVCYIITAFLITCSSASARPYSKAEREAMFIRATKPDYPYEALRRREEGTGLFRLYVNERGRVTTVTILKSTGHQVLDSEGIRVLRAWRARPGERREVDVPLNFVLNGNQSIDNDKGIGKDGLGITKSYDR